MARRLTWLVVFLLVGVAACGSGGSELAASASPSDVVRAYVNAIAHHDIDAAKSILSAKHEREVESQVDSWFTNIKAITNLRILDERAGMSKDYKFAVEVPVTFDLEQVKEHSMMNGNIVWGYQLGRNSMDDPWEIYGEGAG